MVTLEAIEKRLAGLASEVRRGAARAVSDPRAVLLSKSELGAALGMRPSTVDSRLRDGLAMPPAVRLEGSHPRWRLSRVIAWLDEQEQV